VTIRIETEADHEGFAAGFLLFLGVSHIREGRAEEVSRQYGMAVGASRVVLPASNPKKIPSAKIQASGKHQTSNFNPRIARR
jgi:hypothetical protein